MTICLTYDADRHYWHNAGHQPLTLQLLGDGTIHATEPKDP